MAPGLTAGETFDTPAFRAYGNTREYKPGEALVVKGDAENQVLSTPSRPYSRNPYGEPLLQRSRPYSRNPYGEPLLQL